MADTCIPMSTWTPRNGQTYEIVDKKARSKIEALEKQIADLKAEIESAAEVPVSQSAVDPNA